MPAYNCVIEANYKERYFRGLVRHINTDFEYQEYLLKMVKSLLGLNINNPMLVEHFAVLFDLLRSKIFPFRKKDVYDILMESQTKRNIEFIDEIYLQLLNSGIDLLDDDIQRYNLLVAEQGEQKRKQLFVLTYYNHYQEKEKKIQPQLINFIFEVYLSQEIPL